MRILGGILLEIADKEMRISPQILQRNIIVPQPRHVMIAKPVPPIIPMPPVLARARLKIKLARVWTKAQIAATDGSNPIARKRPDAPAAVAVGRVKPVIQSVIEPIDPMLRIAQREPR